MANVDHGPLNSLDFFLWHKQINDSALRPLMQWPQFNQKSQKPLCGSYTLQKVQFHLMQLPRLHEEVSNLHITTAFSQEVNEVSSFSPHAGHNGTSWIFITVKCPLPHKFAYNIYCRLD